MQIAEQKNINHISKKNIQIVLYLTFILVNNINSTIWLAVAQLLSFEYVFGTLCPIRSLAFLGNMLKKQSKNTGKKWFRVDFSLFCAKIWEN